ncbi:uncharacterized protein [Physcomitrium patens]|uniref:uncharacterized protein isoform X2 n=1 Tax=Physcomitrium patens TaxID=3218 RepID=UPI000D16E766|nr:cilia- and flagella-associated protein 157-like [Physcomitrium patens]XP_024388377.1 cilia- and flagella-associated protein 157-like [Physcomitrium patens]|eukprot:XP_024388375.1 cilia- and flagella-associated protein 157-like [Physcomitrella patens]
MAKDGKAGGVDEVDALKAAMLAKDLEVITIRDKMQRLEERSSFILSNMEKLSIGSRDKIASLTEIIAFLTSEGNNKEIKIKELEVALDLSERSRKETIACKNEEMVELANTHEFQLNNMKLKLDAVQVRLRELTNFAAKKEAIENENAVLKEQLLKEQRDHVEAISDVERVSVQEKERLKKEIILRVEETKKSYSDGLQDQLHIKTKMTIAENEQLKAEVAYHIHQTQIMFQLNESLDKEKSEVSRSLQLTKESEEDVVRKNYIYQQTIQVLLHKLQEIKKEKQKNDINVEKKLMDIKNLQSLQNINILTRIKNKKQVVNFLQSCLEDIQSDRNAACFNEKQYVKGDLIPIKKSNLNKSNSASKKLQKLLIKLFQHLKLLKVIPRNMLKDSSSNIVNQSKRKTNLVKIHSKVFVDDILQMPFEKILKGHD